MANVHILGNDGSRWTAVMHYAIPATNNAAGVSWQIIALRKFGVSTILPDGDGTSGTIAASEKADIASGALVERTENFKMSGAPSLAELDAIYTVLKAAFLADMQAKFNRYGTTR